MIDLVPDSFPEEDVRETPEETEHVAQDILSEGSHPSGSLSQVVMKQIDQEAKDASKKEAVAVACGVVVVEHEVVHHVVVHAPGASPKGHN